MDINLTSPIVCSVNSIQPWWVSLFSIASGIIGAIIGASVVLIAGHLERSHERSKLARDERKNAYIKILNLLNTHAITNKFSESDEKDFILCATELLLVGSDDIRKIISEHFGKDNQNGEEAIAQLREALYLTMRDEIQK